MAHVLFNEDDNTAIVVNKGRTFHLSRVHSPQRCAGTHCVMHNPSNHHMRDWDMLFREDKGLMERLCSHGIGHPDPDSLAFFVSQGADYMGVHGCDGCCAEDEGA